MFVPVPKVKNVIIHLPNFLSLIKKFDDEDTFLLEYTPIAVITSR